MLKPMGGAQNKKISPWPAAELAIHGQFNAKTLAMWMTGSSPVMVRGEECGCDDAI
jgi:hypothetical protein